MVSDDNGRESLKGAFVRIEVESCVPQRNTGLMQPLSERHARYGKAAGDFSGEFQMS
jgi:hypothetical protein